jgi:antitoxin (DNA-binding transcriptional repressor) of toxin-antitoxin stability system
MPGRNHFFYLRNNFSKLEAWLGDGESVRIEKRGEPVALLTALPKGKGKAFKMPDFAARRSYLVRRGRARQRCVCS